MKERPILFSDEMVRAILDGRKSQTRRVIKNTGLFAIDEKFHGPESSARERAALATHCPYGTVGDRLWVREAWVHGDTSVQIHQCDPPHYIWYRATKTLHDVNNKKILGPSFPYDSKWKHSIHMPRWASRITLEITKVRVERLHQISEPDAQAEGFINNVAMIYDDNGKPEDYTGRYASERFAEYWDQLNAKRGHSWESNPFVWVIEFKIGE